MVSERCGERESTVHHTVVDDAKKVARTEMLCCVCAGPINQLTDYWERLMAAAQEPLTAESQAELARLQAEGAKLMEELGGPFLPPEVLDQLREMQIDPKLGSNEPRQGKPD
jgi:protein-arginine kinase activator protein McsA